MPPESSGTCRKFDLINAIPLATCYKPAAFMGAAYWIPAFWVPALLVTHYITFVFLIRHQKNTPDHELTIAANLLGTGRVCRPSSRTSRLIRC
jgi:hypothetical protein